MKPEDFEFNSDHETARIVESLKPCEADELTGVILRGYDKAIPVMMGALHGQPPHYKAKAQSTVHFYTHTLRFFKMDLLFTVGMEINPQCNIPEIFEFPDKASWQKDLEISIKKDLAG